MSELPSHITIHNPRSGMEQIITSVLEQEWIIGERQVGKTTLLLEKVIAIIRANNVRVVIVAQTKNDVFRISKLMNQMVDGQLFEGLWQVFLNTRDAATAVKMFADPREHRCILAVHHSAVRSYDSFAAIYGTKYDYLETEFDSAIISISKTVLSNWNPKMLFVTGYNNLKAVTQLDVVHGITFKTVTTPVSRPTE